MPIWEFKSAATLTIMLEYKVMDKNSWSFCFEKNEITKRVKDYSKNRSALNMYYNVGKHYGEGIIK